MSNIERAMARLVKIDDAQKHPNADSLDVCTVGGWKCITKLGEFKKGDLVVYFELDSWIPTEIAPFLSKGKEPREYNGIKGERLRTAKLRGIVSQGLILPFNTIMTNFDGECSSTNWNEGDDVSKILNIQKYEPPISPHLAGLIKGSFPSRIPKTDEERIQNLTKELQEWKEKEYIFERTEKCDGSSMTVYLIDDEFNVCSRNLNLKFDVNNSFWNVAIKDRLEEKLRSFGKNIAIQGELVGAGVNGNLYKLLDHRFYLFNVYDIDKQEYYNSSDRLKFASELGVNHVPVLSPAYITNIEDMLIDADGKSEINPLVGREGIVYKCIQNPEISFKCISNSYLLKN